MAACVRDANNAFHEADEMSGKSARQIAAFVLKASQYAEQLGASFRSLFKPGAPVRFEFSRRYGRAYLNIARNPTVMSGLHVAHMPGDTNSLEQLSLIPPQRLRSLIEDGEVTASTSRNQVAALVKKHRPSDKTSAAKPTRFNADQYLHKIETAFLSGAVTRDQMVQFVNELAIRCELEGRVK
jgi:hypothetical protein